MPLGLSVDVDEFFFFRFVVSWEAEGLAFDVYLGGEAVEPVREPPGAVAEEAEDGWYERHADDVGVDQHADGQAEAADSLGSRTAAGSTRPHWRRRASPLWCCSPHSPDLLAV
jgi:hypothetical protein